MLKVGYSSLYTEDKSDLGYRAAQGKTACLERNAGRIIKSSENAFSPDMLWRYCKMWTGRP